MNSVKNSLQTADRQLGAFYNNPYVLAILLLLLVLYGAFYAPYLPPTLANLFQHPLVKLLILLLIIHILRYNVVLALLLAVVFVLSLQTANAHKIRDISANKERLFLRDSDEVSANSENSPPVDALRGQAPCGSSSAQGSDSIPPGFEGCVDWAPVHG